MMAVCRDQFILPSGNVQIAFSGGRTSAFLLHQILQANGGLPDDGNGRVRVTFQNTGREMPETLDFVHEVGSRWDVPITWLEYRPSAPLAEWQRDAVAKAFGEHMATRLSDWWEPTEDKFSEIGRNSAAMLGEPFLALILARRFLPNVMARFCTTEMKVRVAKRYLLSLGWDHWTNAVGLRADEPHRLNKPPPKDRWVVWHPLAEAQVTRRTVAQFWANQSFDLRLPNVAGNCWLGNCDGCFLKSEASIAAFSRDYQDRASWWEQAERLAALISKAKGMHPGRGAWFSKRYTRVEMRQFMERQGDWALSTDGVLCQANDGECLG